MTQTTARRRRRLRKETVFNTSQAARRACLPRANDPTSHVERTTPRRTRSSPMRGVGRKWSNHFSTAAAATRAKAELGASTTEKHTMRGERVLTRATQFIYRHRRFGKQEQEQSAANGGKEVGHPTQRAALRHSTQGKKKNLRITRDDSTHTINFG